MKISAFWLMTACLVWSAVAVHGQSGKDDNGFELGILRFQPVVKALAAYDSRAIDPPAEPAEGDAYGEAEAVLTIDNTDARYDAGGWASYGYRAYDKYSEIDDDFYGAGASLASRENALKSGISAYFKKTLDYDFRVDGESELGAILTSSTSERAAGTFDMGYERQLTDKSAIMPVYEGSYYYQSFEGEPDAEWQRHRASLKYGYGLSFRTLITLSGGYEIQIDEKETGRIAVVSVGARSRATDKLEWSAELGVSSADYELSGTDEGFVGSLSMNWQAADKISAYVFGGSEYQPGGGGRGARKVYRAGYGATWSIVEKISLNLQILHDYDESIQGTGPTGSDDLRNFVTARMSYDINRNFDLSLAGSLIDDERDENQTIISGQVTWRY